MFSFSCADWMTTPEENVPANDAAVFYLGSPLLAGGSGWESGGRRRVASGVAREEVVGCQMAQDSH